MLWYRPILKRCVHLLVRLAVEDPSEYIDMIHIRNRQNQHICTLREVEMRIIILDIALLVSLTAIKSLGFGFSELVTVQFF